MLSNLDLYVTDELNGVDVHARHPDEWEHLQSCAECRTEYEDLRELLRAEADGALTEVPIGGVDTALAAEPRYPAQDEPWRAIIEQRADQRPSLRFIFSPVYLRKSLRTGSQLTGRVYRSAGEKAASLTEDEQEPGVLLLNYVDETPAGEIAVEVWARPAVVRGEQLLLVQTVAEFRVTRAELTWSGQSRQAGIRPDGMALLGPVPLSALDLPPFIAGEFTLRLIP